MERKMDAPDVTDSTHKPKEEIHQQLPVDESQVSPGSNASNGSEKKPPKESKEAIRRRKLIAALHKALCVGDEVSVVKLFNKDPELLAARISLFGDNALHIAVLAGHVTIVGVLVRLTAEKLLTVTNDYGETALTLAAAGGVIEVAKALLVRKNDHLLGMANVFDCIPVVVAAQCGHKNMAHFLYSRTREEHFSSESGKHGAKLITTCITTQLYDIALDMLQRYPDLCVAALKDSAGEALNPLARHSAFRNASPHFACWPQRTFSYLYMKQMRQAKSENAQARELLNCICNKLMTLSQWYRGAILHKPIFTAVSCGNVGFIAEVATTFPDMPWVVNLEGGRTLFSYAISERQDKVFRFLHRMGAMQRQLAIMLDNDRNSILHQAAMLSPTYQRGRISGAALQMQRELQWFKAVEKIAPMYKEAVNKDGKTPRDLFTEQHENLVKEGEKWMKETATSCTVVAALIVTIMFAAAFTVPGGYDGGTGIPIYLHSNYFILFIVSDALSLFFASISVLMFLRILTSLYREEDFLISLPTKWISGLSALGLSIAAMMITFGTAIVMMLHKRFVHISLPVIILASIPVIFFFRLQFPILVRLIWSTYRPGIIDP